VAKAKSAWNSVWEWAGRVDTIQGRLRVIFAGVALIVGGCLVLLRAMGVTNTLLAIIGAVVIALGIFFLVSFGAHLKAASAAPPEPTSGEISRPPDKQVAVRRERQTLLTGHERDDLRRFIAQGEELCVGLDLHLDDIETWATEVALWLGAHHQGRYVNRFRFSDPCDSEETRSWVIMRVVDLRVLVLNHTPAGFSHELTPVEAVERWAQVHRIPGSQTQKLVDLTERYLREMTDQDAP
jgi:hypothetical protein